MSVAARDGGSKFSPLRAVVWPTIFAGCIAFWVWVCWQVGELIGQGQLSFF
jgi:hypothetical protein